MAEEFENATITGHFGFVFDENWVNEIMIIVKLSVSKTLDFGNVSHPDKNAKPVFSNSFSLKSIFEKLRFHDGLVWTVR